MLLSTPVLRADITDQSCAHTVAESFGVIYSQGHRPNPSFQRRGRGSVENRYQQPRTSIHLRHFNEVLLRIDDAGLREESSRWLFALHDEFLNGRANDFNRWLMALSQQDTINVSHKIYEAHAALLILQNTTTQVTFETGNGFFSRPNGRTEKSMDLQVSSIRSVPQVLAYREVKTVESRNHIKGALNSAVAKAAVAREHTSDRIELGAILYVHSTDPNASRGAKATEEFYKAVDYACESLGSRRPVSQLDQVTLIDVEANRYALLVQRADGGYDSAIYPLR